MFRSKLSLSETTLVWIKMPPDVHKFFFCRSTCPKGTAPAARMRVGAVNRFSPLLRFISPEVCGPHEREEREKGGFERKPHDVRIESGSGFAAFHFRGAEVDYTINYQ